MNNEQLTVRDEQLAIKKAAYEQVVAKRRGVAEDCRRQAGDSGL
jgi:hypothetical protein